MVINDMPGCTQKNCHEIFEIKKSQKRGYGKLNEKNYSWVWIDDVVEMPQWADVN